MLQNANSVIVLSAVNQMNWAPTVVYGYGPWFSSLLMRTQCFFIFILQRHQNLCESDYALVSLITFGFTQTVESVTTPLHGLFHLQQ